MLLLTFNELSGVQSGKRQNIDECKTEQKVVAFGTNLPLPAALARIRQYEDAYKRRYRLFFEFSLIGYAQIPYLNDNDQENARLQMIEDLQQTVEDFQ